MYIPLLLLLLLLSLSSSSLGADIITLLNANDFTKFVDEVNSGNNYSGTTVYLGSDITLTESIDPIGINSTNYFRGTFDGRGNVISNLNINSSEYPGLFGYSRGLTVRNVVLDDSCSITSTPNSSGHVRTGGIIGGCYIYSGHCSIENSVNMADVSFSGNISNNLFIGGIVGRFYSSSNYNAYVKNCVNYGSITDSGTVSGTTELGGIVGISEGSLSTYSKYIQNCLNYGTITHSGKTSGKLIIGGVVGNSYSRTYIENCVSAGKISTSTKAPSINYIGNIAGYVGSSRVHINYCYYTSDVNVSNINGTGTPSSTTGTPDSPANIDFDLVSKLNSNATSCNWDKWFILHLTGGSINNLAQDPLIGIQGQIPNPIKEGNSFLFWCKEAECTEVFEAESVSGITNLYAAWVNNTVTFDVSGGNPLSKDEATKIVTFNEKYGELPEPSRTGYMFVGWFNESNELITNETIVTTPKSHTLYAQWEEVTNQVEIVFDTKDLTKEDVEKFIEQYTKADFEIIKYEEESGEIRTVVKFADKEDAEKFIRNINESDETKGLIKRIDFDQGDDNSFSPMTYPLSLLSLLFL